MLFFFCFSILRVLACWVRTLYGKFHYLPILFNKYFSPLVSHRIGLVFKICVWISVFRRKKLFKNPILSCRDINQNPSLIFFWDTQYDLVKTANDKCKLCKLREQANTGFRIL